ncbi:MAG: hypothetical protein U0800_22490 [Isosphaeraceae bacterium]
MIRPKPRHLLFAAPLVLIGCTDKSQVKEESRVETPSGTSKVTRTTEVENSGSKPPLGPATNDTVPGTTRTPGGTTAP